MALEAIAMEGPEARVSDQVARLITTCSRGWEPLRDNTRQHEPYNLQSQTLWCARCEADADHGAYCCLGRLWRTQGNGEGLYDC